MKLTKKLLGFINKVFDKDPAPFLALRLRYVGDGMSWTVQDAVLRTTPAGGLGAPLVVDLRAYRIGELVNYLAAQTGYTVEYVDLSELSLLSAACLLDGSGDIAASNGDHLYAYTSFLWAYYEAHAVELKSASEEIEQMLAQMSTKTAAGEWLDELGSYYNVPRLTDEPDRTYALRIIAEVLRPRGNNVALEAAIQTFTGQPVSVLDVVIYGGLAPLHDGTFDYDGSQLHNSTGGARYGLFDVAVGYDLIGGGDLTVFQQTVREVVGRLRDAGTHMRSLLLRGSEIADNFTPPTDGSGLVDIVAAGVMVDGFNAPTDMYSLAANMPAISDTLSAPTDGLAAVVTSQFKYNAIRTHNGAITHRGVSASAEDIGTPGDMPFSGILVADGRFTANGTQVSDGLI